MRHQYFYVIELTENGCHFSMYTSDAQQISIKIAIVSLLQIPSAIILPNIFLSIYIWESYHKNKRVNVF